MAQGIRGGRDMLGCGGERGLEYVFEDLIWIGSDTSFPEKIAEHTPAESKRSLARWR